MLYFVCNFDIFPLISPSDNIDSLWSHRVIISISFDLTEWQYRFPLISPSDNIDSLWFHRVIISIPFDLTEW
jgi:hypothetical protein